MAAAAPMLIAQGSSAISGLGSSYVQARAQRAQGRFEARSAKLNAQLAALQAEDAIRRGDVDVAAQNRRTKQLIGSQRAALAASGVGLGFGSALDVPLETATMGGMDAITLRNNAYREALGYKVAAADARMRGRLAKISGNNAYRQTLLAGGMRAASELTGGVSRAFKY